MQPGHVYFIFWANIFHSSSSLCSYSPSYSITWTKAFDQAQGLSYTQKKAWPELLLGVGPRQTTACSMSGQSSFTWYTYPIVRISHVSSGVLPEMVWRLQAARHVGFMGHLSLAHPMTATAPCCDWSVQCPLMGMHRAEPGNMPGFTLLPKPSPQHAL